VAVANTLAYYAKNAAVKSFIVQKKEIGRRERKTNFIGSIERERDKNTLMATLEPKQGTLTDGKG
jgi:hypothetical protein